MLRGAAGPALSDPPHLPGFCLPFHPPADERSAGSHHTARDPVLRVLCSSTTASFTTRCEYIGDNVLGLDTPTKTIN
ncbi:hypothetical protein EYF80_002282 [Liparis tanakae]|uniref:Uncharacterized protein n=1 Tax=Liparis tanakae TaxID=230148 RepID=A0A4Z2JB65_9TELE|nr:hypothetical protein EYF80_002282 [Liparis tanakae]